ncbi:fimbria/pilus outer membrane usher protein [Entomohabitans teleogrylli]|uniref:fimbria/pilus outer membrane usher protein n=1 Tax=Entomohabitans teleogrylli TaxID=1384589 RepID=UPI00073D6F64|nr:fimbria/pilus outer membrane usher protein [Entomohabitans teleogrylli]
MQGITLPGKLARLCCRLIMSALTFTVQAEEASVIEFDPSFLILGKDAVSDLARFSHGGSATPGIHRTRLFFNNQLYLNQEIAFVTQTDKSVVPCLTPSLLIQLPIDHTRLAEDTFARQANHCIDLPAVIPGASVTFDSNGQVLNIEVPQIYESRTARASVPPSLWDDGIPAALLGYNLNAYSSESRDDNYSNMYAGINGGINLGRWYLRHNGTWNWNNRSGGRYQTLNTYAQHDIPVIKGRVSIGQVNTSGQLFDTLPFNGIKLESDERMEPLSRRGYAPEIHGIARTNARVTVYQKGNLIYDTVVSPGAFVIDDLYPTGYGGDLEVMVHEADGSEQYFQVPYASVTPLVRPGMARYEFSVGKLNNRYLHNNPLLWQGSRQYGVNNLLTIYGGVQGGDNYYAGQGGGAVAMPFGAVSADITHARSNLGNIDTGEDKRRGESYRISYSKYIAETRSQFALAAYRFSTNGYMDYLTVMQTRDRVYKGYDRDIIRRNKSRYTLTVTQGLPDNWGQFYLSSSIQNYWNASGNDKQYQVGYSNSWKRLSYGVNGGRTWNAYGHSQDTVSLNFSLPLGASYNSPIGQFSYDRSSNGRHNQRAGLSGSAGEDSSFNYGLSATTDNQGAANSGAVNAQYRSPVTSVNAAYSTGRHYRSVSGGVSGTVIGHSAGVTLSPWQGETFALVEAKGAEGAKVSGYSGVYIDSQGYALVPYLNPYQLNDIRIDLKGTAGGVELDTTSQKVAPLDGAVVKVNYITRHGWPALITITGRETPLPFGAEVRNTEGQVVGYVGQGGQIYARLERDSGTLIVNNGADPQQTCQFNYRLKNEHLNKTALLEEIITGCNPPVVRG